MRRLALIPILGLLGMFPASAGEGDFTVSGTIAVGNPDSRVYGGLTEIGSPCMGSVDPDVPDGAFQGVDGYWIQLPIEELGVFDGMKATLTSDTLDVDAWFYDEACGFLTEPVDTTYSMAGDRVTFPWAEEVPEDAPEYSRLTGTRLLPDGDELNGVIPEGTGWVVVDLYAGANASFTFTVDNVPDEPAV